MAKRKVLIVEDDADLRRLYAIGLTHRGYAVKLAANGAEALDRIAQEKPDVILLDLMMPVMSGWEVLDKLDPEDRRSIPVIVISGHSGPPEHLDHDCVVGWLPKPIAIEDLASSVATAVPRRTSARPVA